MVKKEMKGFIVMMMVMIVVQAGYGTGHIPSLLAPFLFSPPLLFPLHSMIAYFERKNIRPQMSIEFL